MRLLRRLGGQARLANLLEKQESKALNEEHDYGGICVPIRLGSSIPYLETWRIRLSNY